ncbi:hypothetical protein [Nonomuraea sp. NPDC050691]|uniref:hypothetical protein n=1 Tax=Nonomuraea sp. NPDC050691 TaxID=3155661 RepID=UPI003404F136
MEISELTEDELRHRSALLRELLDLRSAALTRGSPPSVRPYRNLWAFDDGRPITIVSAQVPADMLRRMPYSDPKDPDYVELYNYADLDALVELYGHIRACNPDTETRLRRTSTLTSDDYRGHLILLGGIDWNEETRKLLSDPSLPVEQVAHWETAPQGTYFEIDEGGRKVRHHPQLSTEEDGTQVLQQDIGHFYRGPNPYFRRSTITLCNGMYARGTLGVVRALTDPEVRDDNTAYVNDRFGSSATYSILSRVVIIDGKILSPDWQMPENRLHEWTPLDDEESKDEPRAEDHPSPPDRRNQR